MFTDVYCFLLATVIFYISSLATRVFKFCTLPCTFLKYSSAFCGLSADACAARVVALWEKLPWDFEHVRTVTAIVKIGQQMSPAGCHFTYEEATDRNISQQSKLWFSPFTAVVIKDKLLKREVVCDGGRAVGQREAIKSSWMLCYLEKQQKCVLFFFKKYCDFSLTASDLSQDTVESQETQLQPLLLYCNLHVF